MNPVLISIILIPILEIYLFIKIGAQIGAFNTIFLIIMTAFIGVYYAKYEGLNTIKSGLMQIVKNQTPIILALDSDMIDKSYSIADSLSSYGVQVKILNLGKYKDVGSMTEEIVRQKCIEAPIYSRHNRLRHLIGTISSGSIF